MIARRQLLAASAALMLTPALAHAQAPSSAEIAATMKRATRFMVEKLAYRGGYLWSYLPDRSRVWGELEAYKTMVWVQPPGSATMGHLYLDAYHATGDDYYYQAAAKAAQALIDGQLPTGGWGYFIDFGGPASTRRWYETIGKNAWRMEEFQHHWGNATFDDQGTGEAIRFLIRLYVEKREKRFKRGLDKAINFIFASQLDNGGWPQRWPRVRDGGLHGKPDYTGLITFNDGVIHDNIDVLLTYHQAIGDPRVLPAIERAMDIYLKTQQPAPQAGWGLQHRADFSPAGARTYEPEALVTHTTASNVEDLMEFYRLTGNAKYLAPIPAALDWLESVRLPEELRVGTRHFPTFVEIGSNKPLWVPRRGSHVV
ncbi:MAG: pectate lyase, partial [Sphingomonas sp.]